ncbi:structural maintenance of chromosomes protein 6 [Trichoplusia ni]|uniref:Structural maintenance of chromosomes protein 6 n=1 Tax=Trichoplusia ni TaxID=7111 RepID=A0A7E5VU79_TRINI|nr:structural maintenance of chromosomes protein 6 [Trichoplusia ni]
MASDIFEEDTDGSIVSIHVRNFFCHDNLKVNLNRNVNFIVGRNGSGKSAVLTALVVGLGGRASDTNRGSNLHSFIKKGANSATIEIKIKNNSSKAYKHNIYGDYITVVRHINVSGGSSYKVKSAAGDIISKKYEEVNAIILAHDIQVDNPISVLNQDDARSFHASDAKKKYSLFRRATNLDQTENNYIRALDNCKRATAIWTRKKEACADLEKEYTKWKTSHEQLRSRDEIKAIEKSLQNEYYWSEVTDLERNVNKIQKQYDKQKAEMDKLREKLSQMEQNYGNNSTAIDELKSLLQAKSEEKSALESEMRALEAEMNSAQAQRRAAQHDAGKHGDALNREKRKVADLEKEIQTFGYDTAQHEAAQARDNLAHAQAHADQLQARAHRHADSIRQLKQQLRELESRGDDSLAVYGSNMVELCQRVKAAVDRGHFSKPPKGPIGAYLKVKEKRWGGALEHILGGSIQSFCVNTAEDSRKLIQIMNQVYGSAAKPGVTCSRFLPRAHDVRRTRVAAPGFVSALDSLDVADPVVANFLIDNVAMESVLLVPDHDDAVRLSDTEENVPVNCAKIVTLDSTEYHPAPNYRIYGGAGRTSRFLHLSTAERKKQVLAEIKEAEATLQGLEAKAEEACQEAARARDGERGAHERAEAARGAAAALQLQQAPQYAVLVDELNISKEKMNTLNQQVEELSKKQAQYRQKIEEYETKMRSVKNQLAEVTTNCRNLREEIDQEQMKLDQGVTKRKMYEQRLREDGIKMTQVEVILGDKRNDINKKIEAAQRLCPRVENPRDVAIVTNELKKIQLKLSAIRSDGLTEAEVTERLLQVERKYRRTRLTLERLKTLIDDMKVTTDKHLKFCYSVQTSIARRVQHSFQAMLTLRGYSGRMDIDNGAATLEIVCSGREGEARRAASTSSLSGGERSYSTVAFIMALWDCVELPFCFMDEFDVFMDNVNRKIVMDLLIDHALHNTNRQFVFLTPQDASSVTAGPQISIHLMADPRP